MVMNLDGCEFVQKYFGKYLEELAGAQPNGRFIQVINNPKRLEQRLRKLEPKLMHSILAEVGDNVDVNLLDDRLMNAWAELRTISQLQKEGFTQIGKVYKTADFVARLLDKDYAIQVTRINRFFSDKMMKYSPSGVVDDEPFGDTREIYERFREPLSYLFWDTLKDKNSDFRKLEKNGFTRCLVIVSSEEILQDAFVRHIACIETRKGIQELSQSNFEELLWLPDLSNGALFKLSKTKSEIKCLIDWCDDLPFDECEVSVNRREVNLNSLLPN